MGRVGWVGWGWWRLFHLHTCEMLRTWRFLHLHTCDMLRKWWAGLGGWGGDDDVSITCTHVTCYALDVSCTCTHVTCYVLDVSITCTHETCYALDVSCACTHVTCYVLNVSCTCTHVTCYASDGQGWVGGVGMMTFLSLAHMWHATHLTLLALAHMWHAMYLTYLSLAHMWHATHLTFLALAHMWHATHLTFLALAHMWHATQVMGRVGWVGWVGQFTKWHSKTRLTGTQALDKVWLHLTKHVPKSLCVRSKTDRRFNPRMEQYVYSYMWRFNNRNWWKQLGQLCQQHWQKENTSANEGFFLRCFLLPNLNSQKNWAPHPVLGVFYASVKIQNRKKKRGN